MLKNMLLKLRSLYRTKVEDTTKEWEEQGRLSKPPVLRSNVVMEIDLPFWQRIRFLLTNKAEYRLTVAQQHFIKLTLSRLVKK